MESSASVKEPFMTRTVCTACDHMHRSSLRKKCACCAVDIGNAEDEGFVIL